MQPCRFIARRATNGAPPSEATQPALLLRVGYGVIVTVTESEYAPTETFWPGGIRP